MMVYRTGQYVTNSSNSTEDQESIMLLQEVADRLKYMAKVNLDSKNFFHVIGMQGFKRYHRYEAREALEEAMCLESLMIDHYGVEPKYVAIEFTPCQKRTAMERIQHYADELEKSLEMMNEVKTELINNNHHFAAQHIQRIIDKIEKELKYTYRHLNYCKDVNGDANALHWYSHELHEEYRCKEKRDHARDIQ